MDYCFFLLLLPVIVLLKKRKEASDGDVVGNRIRRNNKLKEISIASQKKQINKEPFYVALEKAMHNF
jgi:hypothetical protein